MYLNIKYLVSGVKKKERKRINFPCIIPYIDGRLNDL